MFSLWGPLHLLGCLNFGVSHNTKSIVLLLVAVIKANQLYVVWQAQMLHDKYVLYPIFSIWTFYKTYLGFSLLLDVLLIFFYLVIMYNFWEVH